MHTNRHYSSKVGNLPLLKSCYHHPSAPQSTTATINKTRALEQGCLNHMLAFHRVCHLFMATGGATTQRTTSIILKENYNTFKVSVGFRFHQSR